MWIHGNVRICSFVTLGNISVIGHPLNMEHLNEWNIPLGPVAHSRHGRDENKKTLNPKRIIRREGKTIISAQSSNVNALLKYLNHGKKYVGKREHNRKQQVFKCLQQPSDGITCFGNGKFYQFTGSLEGLSAGSISEMVRESEGTKTRESLNNAGSDVRNHAEYMSGCNGRFPLKKLWKKRSPGKAGHQGNAKPYQEVLMQSHGLAAGPRDCYGFIAPKLVHRPQNAISKTATHASWKKCGHRTCSCGGGCSRQARKRRLTDGKKTHAVWKRSHIITVACRPLYVPTPKPSVNEGRVAKCRLPCGEHNCLVVPTCPCMPPCKTQAPCPSTCPPEKPIPSCTKPPDVPRCPPYEITEEPCPSFPCPDKFPFLTTPHCPCSKESCSSCSCTKETPCGRTACTDKPSCNSKNMAGIITTVKSSKNTTGIIPSAVANVSSSTPRLSSAVAAIVANGTTKNELTVKNMRGNVTTRTEPLEVEPVKIRPRMMGLWPSFDLRKLLKSAKYQNKDKTEQDKVERLLPV